MAQRGYLGVRLEDIGNAAGISGPAVYRHFASKDGVLAELLVGVSERLLRDGSAVQEATEDAEQVLRGLIDLHVDFALTEPELILIDDRDRAHLPAPALDRLRRIQRRYVAIWVDAVAAAVPSGDPVVDRTRVHAVLGLINSTPRASRRAARHRTRAVVTHMAAASLGLPGAAATARSPVADAS